MTYIQLELINPLETRIVVIHDIHISQFEKSSKLLLYLHKIFHTIPILKT